METGDLMKIIFGALLLVGIFGIIFGLFYQVSEGERAILLTWGKASNDIKSQGLHMKIPVAQSVVKMEIRTQKYEAEATAASQDLQIVTANIATNYHISEGNVVDIYRNLGLGYADRVISPLEQEAVKATTARYTAEQLITKREEVRLEIKQLLSDRLSERGILVEEVSITNFDFSPTFNQAIEAKVQAEQLKLKADRDLERIKVEKEQKITQAEAEAQSIKIQSEALRQNQDILKLRAIEKWDGVMPLVVGESMPFISVPIGEK